jgi:hypothetical protein
MADGDLLLNHFLDSVNSISALGDASVGGFRRSPPAPPKPSRSPAAQKKKKHPTRPPGLPSRSRSALACGAHHSAAGRAGRLRARIISRAPRWSPGSVAETIAVRSLMTQHGLKRIAVPFDDFFGRDDYCAAIRAHLSASDGIAAVAEGVRTHGPDLLAI